MREHWLQLYIAEHYRELGFSQLEGPFDIGPDFRGIYQGQQVRVEAENDYNLYSHPREWADVLVVATLKPVPARWVDRLPPTIINVDPEKVAEWSLPLRRTYAQKMQAERHSVIVSLPPEIQADVRDIAGDSHLSAGEIYNLAFLPWRTLAKSLECLCGDPTERAELSRSGIIEEDCLPDDERIKLREYDLYWLRLAEAVAKRFGLQPSAHSVTWIDTLARRVLKGRALSPDEQKMLEPVIAFIASQAAH